MRKCGNDILFVKIQYVYYYNILMYNIVKVHIQDPLRYRKAWSRRINDMHRLVYNFDDKNNLWIISCKRHYED